LFSLVSDFEVHLHFERGYLDCASLVSNVLISTFVQRGRTAYLDSASLHLDRGLRPMHLVKNAIMQASLPAVIFCNLRTSSHCPKLRLWVAKVIESTLPDIRVRYPSPGASVCTPFPATDLSVNDRRYLPQYT